MAVAAAWSAYPVRLPVDRIRWQTNRVSSGVVFTHLAQIISAVLALDRRARVNVQMALQLAELVQNQTGHRPAVMPYVWLWPPGTNDTSSYGNKPAKGLDLAASVQVPAAMGADGVILW